MRRMLFITAAIFFILSALFFVSKLTTLAQTGTLSAIEITQKGAITADEKALIDEILRELDSARKMTSNKDIQNQLNIIRDWTRKVLVLIDKGDSKGALEIKYSIARRLEELINQLPTTSTGTTTATTAPSANPLYDELVRIRAKFDKLIAIEEREVPAQVTPGKPEITRPPEMEKLIVYSAKFLCGPAFGGEGVQAGSYSTAINIHNPHNYTVYLFKKAVIAQRENEPRGRISGFHKIALAPDEAIEVDCFDIVSFFGPQDVNLLPSPTQRPGVQQPTISTEENKVTATIVSSAIKFVKGFVVIYATAPLDVVGVYSASTPSGFSLDIEHIPQSTVGVIPVPIPDEPTETTCPTGCICLSKDEAYKKFGDNMQLCQREPCGYADREKNIMLYCWRPGEPMAQCPAGCICITEIEAKKLGATDMCSKEPCGKDQYGNVLYCFKRPVTTTQPKAGKIIIDPATDRNAVGTRHTFNIVVYDTEGKPLPNTRVKINHSGAHTFAPIELVTDINGRTSYYYEGVNAGTDTVIATVDSVSARATKEWYAVNRPAKIELSPGIGHNAPGQRHTVVATVWGTDGRPMAGITVNFSVSGTNNLSGSMVTNSSGQATFSYSSKLEGRDTITATVDTLKATATKYWEILR